MLLERPRPTSGRGATASLCCVALYVRWIHLVPSITSFRAVTEAFERPKPAKVKNRVRTARGTYRGRWLVSEGCGGSRPRSRRRRLRPSPGRVHGHLKLPGCSQAAPLSYGRWCGDVSALYLMEYLLVRVRHARSTNIEAAHPSRGTASESHREDCAPGSAEARLLPTELGMGHR